VIQYFFHAVVWKTAFGDRRAAGAALDDMPPEIRSGAWIMDMNRPGVKIAVSGQQKG